MTFLGAGLALRSALEHLLHPATELVVTGCVKCTFCHMSQSSREIAHCFIKQKETTLQIFFFFLICRHLIRHPLNELFHFSSLLQMPNDHSMVDFEFFGNFLCSCKRISFCDCFQLVIVNLWWLATMLIFKALVSFAEFLEPPLHCMFISSSWARCVVNVASCLPALWPSELKFKNHSNLLFV